MRLKCTPAFKTPCLFKQVRVMVYATQLATSPAYFPSITKAYPTTNVAFKMRMKADPGVPPGSMRTGPTFRVEATMGTVDQNVPCQVG